MMKNIKLFKKTCSLLVTLVMLFSLLGSYNMVAYAADTEIDVVDVTITMPLANDSNTDVAYSVPAGENYTVTPKTSKWLNPDMVSEASNFHSGEEYTIEFEVTANTGYCIGTNTKVKVNGEEAGIHLTGSMDAPASEFELKAFPIILGTIDTVDFPNFPEGAIGETADPYSVTGANYSISGGWSVNNRNTGNLDPLDSTHTFAAGNVYIFNVDLIPNPGYIISDTFSATKNGTTPMEMSYSRSWAGKNIAVSYVTEIPEATYDASAALQIKVGDTYDGSPVSISIPDGSNYTAEAYWYDENGNYPTVFENGKSYHLSIKLETKAGYSFAEYTMVNDETLCSSDRITIWDDVEKSFKTTIDEAVVTGVVEPAVGQSIPEGASGGPFDLTVPSGAKYKAQGFWCDSEGNPVSGKFEEGKAYTLEIYVSADADSEFSEDATISINGVKYGISNSTGYNDGNYILYMKDYSLRKMIDKVEITGYKEPVVGETTSVDNIKVPSDANYQINYKEWFDWDTGAPVVKFEDGKTYFLDMLLSPKEGYEFAEDVVVLLDGKDITDDCGINPTELNIMKDVWFKDIIPEVKLDNIQTPAVGATASSDVKVPNDANYQLDNAYWQVWNEKEMYYEPFEGKFEAGKSYALQVNISPKEGYMFDDEKTTFYANGAVEDSATINRGWVYYLMTFSPGMKVIDKVEFTIEAPVVGGHASINPVITVPDGANYYVEDTEYTYPKWIEGNMEEWDYIYSYFEAGESYGTVFNIFATAGYIFSDELQVIINGIRLNDENVDEDDKATGIIYFFDEECNHSYSAWKDAGDGNHVRDCAICGYKDIQKHTYEGSKCSVCSAVKSDNSPATGDVSSMMNVFALMMICGLGIIGLEKRKRYLNR